jgi:hypothetical protein
MGKITMTFHAGKSLANQTLEWLPTDTKETFDQLMQHAEHRQYFAVKGWDQPGAITYQLNSEGFRCAEFTQDPCLVALGCSYTLGSGLPVECTWPTLVGQALNLPVVNLAWMGYSADSCFRMAEYWLPRLNAQHVVMLTPFADRVEVLTESGSITYMPGNISSTTSDAFLTHWVLNNNNGRLNSVKNKLAVKQLCQELKISCQIYDANIYMADSREKLEYARDYMHAGPRGHRILAERIIYDFTTTK